MDKSQKLKALNTITKNTLMETLAITYTDVGEDYLVATMPINSTVHQPMGLLHGGATVALARARRPSGVHMSIMAHEMSELEYVSAHGATHGTVSRLEAESAARRLEHRRFGISVLGRFVWEQHLGACNNDVE